MVETIVPEVQIASMGESALLISFGSQISSRLNRLVHDLRQRILTCAFRGITEVVPGYTSLLICFDNRLASHVELSEAIYQLVKTVSTPDESIGHTSRLHVIPVQYSGAAGPDLETVAQFHGLTQDEVVNAHTAREYTVAFLGFLPGFAYMAKVAPAIETSRLATPRTRVSAGSVGIAGAQTGIYPFASPGGWQILGRTSVRTWDPYADQPALFAPGDKVRFARSAYQPEEQVANEASPDTTHPAFEVLSPGGMSMIQDQGRVGLGHFGVARGGVFDRYAATRANALVGNEPNAALLEMTWSGPTLAVLRNVTIALDGADLECRVDGAPVPPRLSWFVRRGSTLRFSGNHSELGVRGYLAVAGGFDVPVVLGSRSTSLQAKFGGYAGRVLQAGDTLGIGSDTVDPGLRAGKFWPGGTAGIPGHLVKLRYIPYSGRGQVLQQAARQFAAQTWELSRQADRMGFRFQPADGPTLPTHHGELASFGVVRGAIQLPPDGNPLLLNVDHQTTGGYPLLGVVAEADWPLVAQLAPGAKVTFEQVSLKDALVASVSARSDLAAGLRRLGRHG
ncbi:MAG: 5-oxoprolinase subunit PxpB [Chloroflexota bacterium]